MVRHVFLWNVADNADPNEIIRILDDLADKVPGIRSWSRGPHQGAPGASGDLWQYGLVCDFDSYEDLQAYSDHPLHIAAVEKLLPMFSTRAVCDFEFDGAGGAA